MSDEPTKGPTPSDDDATKSEDARKVILARRRRFVAVALTSAGVAAGASSCDKNPLVCLSPVPVEDDAGPKTCLSTDIDPGPPDAGVGDAGSGGSEDAGDAGTEDAGDGGVAEDADAGDGGKPPPRVCLRVAPPPKPPPTVPKPCLKFAPPDVDKQKM